MKTHPDTKRMLEIVHMVSQVTNFENSISDPAMQEMLLKASRLSQDLLKDLEPKGTGEVYLWAAGSAGDVRDRMFTKGPSQEIWNIDSLKDGDIIVGMDIGGHVIRQGKASASGSIDWGYQLNSDRNDLASKLLMSADFDNALDHQSMVVDQGTWQTTEPSNEMTMTLYVDTGEAGADSVMMDLFVRFAPNEARIVEATFNGDDINYEGKYDNVEVSDETQSHESLH
jgi:hypothetical protein